MVTVLWEEEDEPSSRVPLAIILPTAALPYVPGCGGETCACWARCASGRRLRGGGMPLHEAHRPFCVPHQPAEGDREAGGEGDDDSAVVVVVHGGDGAPTVLKAPNGGWTAPWRVVVMVVVGDVNRGVRPRVWQRPGWCAPGGAGGWCRRVLVGEDVQPLNVGAAPPPPRHCSRRFAGSECAVCGV